MRDLEKSFLILLWGIVIGAVLILWIMPGRLV